MYTTGSILIALGFFVLIVGTLGGLGYWIYTLAETNQLPLAVGVTGVSLIIMGYIVHFIFRNRNK